MVTLDASERSWRIYSKDPEPAPEQTLFDDHRKVGDREDTLRAARLQTYVTLAISIYVGFGDIGSF